MSLNKKTTIKILLWDIDGTVLDFKAAEKAAIRKGFREMHLGECTDEMIADYSGINDKYWRMLEAGELTKPEVLTGRFREFFQKYGVDTAKVEAFNEQYQYDLGDTICFRDHSYELIRSLQGIYKQFAVTNGTAIAQHRKLQLSGLVDLLDDCFISDEIGVEKPNKGFFDAAFASIHTQFPDLLFTPEEVMIIGDSLTSDIRGGNNAGIRTCWYNPFEKTAGGDIRIDWEIRDLNEIKRIL